MRVRFFVIKLAATMAGLALVVAMWGRMVRPASAQQAPAAQSDGSQGKADQRTQLLLMESQEEADKKSAGCKSCHTKSDSATMHSSSAVRLGCTDCHGGNEKIFAPPQSSPQSAEYITAKNQAHPQPHVLSKDLAG